MPGWSVGGGGVDGGADEGDLVGGEAGDAGVLVDGVRVGGDVDALDLVACDEALNLLELGADASDDAAGFLGDGFALVWVEVAGFENFAVGGELGYEGGSLR